MAQLDAWFEPKPTAIVDSGNGIQCLWRLQEPIELGAPRKNEHGKLVFYPEDQEKIEGVEARIKAVMERLGGKAGTQNIDRILRLPGTTNLPGEKKKKAGRVPCRTQLIYFNGVAHSLSAFPLPTDGGRQAGTDRGQRASSVELPPALLSLLYLTEPGAYASRSELLFAFITGALRKGVDDDQSLPPVPAKGKAVELRAARSTSTVARTVAANTSCDKSRTRTRRCRRTAGLLARPPTSCGSKALVRALHRRIRHAAQGGSVGFGRPRWHARRDRRQAAPDEAG